MHVFRLRLIVASLVVAGVMGVTGGVAAADHAHFIHQPAHGAHAETCRYIAAGQTAKDMDEPGGHSFHVNVHTGRPGSDDKGTGFDKVSNAGEPEYVNCDFVNSP